MPVTVAKMIDRLAEHHEMLDLEKGDMRRIFRLLKCIERSPKGIRYSKLKDKSVRTQWLKFSNSYLVAYMKWLEANGFIIDSHHQKLLTTRGEDALLWLHGFLVPAESKLKYALDSSQPKEAEASIKGNISDTTKNGIFSKDFVQQRILELSSALCTLGQELRLEIIVPPIDSEIAALLRFMWEFYWKKATESGRYPNPLGPLRILIDEKSEARYTRFWKKHLATALSFGDLTIIVGNEIHPLVPDLPDELSELKHLVIDPKINRWIEFRLDKDADWFMPHHVWVNLGFKRRRDDLSVDSFSRVSPPIFHEIKSPSLPSLYGEFDINLNYAIQQDSKKGAMALCSWIRKNAKWATSDFFESWRIIRQEKAVEIGKRPKIYAISQIIDQALIDYVVSSHVVDDVQIALHDYLDGKDLETIINNMKKGTYTISDKI